MEEDAESVTERSTESKMENLVTEKGNQEDLDPGKAKIIPLVYRVGPLCDLYPCPVPACDR